MALMPMNRVFGTTQLLEAIILQLPCREVFLAQGVARYWKATIAGLAMLQKALFLRPTTDAINPPTVALLDWRQPSWGFVDSCRVPPVTAASMLELLTTSPSSFFINPVLNRLMMGCHLFRLTLRNEHREPFILASCHDTKPITELRQTWSSVRRQLSISPVADIPLTSSPLQSLKLAVIYAYTCHDEHYGEYFPGFEQIRTLSGEDYVRVRDFVRLVDRVIDLCESGEKAYKSEDGTQCFSGFNICWGGK